MALLGIDLRPQPLSQVLLGASVDTTSSVVNWSLIALATNPGVQERLADELRATLGGGPLTESVAKSRSGLQYLQAVVREQHRIRPAMPLNLMKTVAADTMICGYRVPAGTMVLLDSYSIQQDPEIVPEPQEFRPERWLPEQEASRKV